jgi:hypothetical protein
MDNKDGELETFILERLEKSIPPNDIILHVCQRTGMYWPDALELVKQVQAENSLHLERRKIPWHFALALATAIGGIGMLIAAIIPFLNFFSGPNAIPFTGVNILFFALNLAPYSSGLLLTGTAMLAGSMVGMRQTWSSLLETFMNALEK